MMTDAKVCEICCAIEHELSFSDDLDIPDDAYVEKFLSAAMECFYE